MPASGLSPGKKARPPGNTSVGDCDKRGHPQHGGVAGLDAADRHDRRTQALASTALRPANTYVCAAASSSVSARLTASASVLARGERRCDQGVVHRLVHLA